MKQYYLKPINDLVFKLIFADLRNIDVLASFLQSILTLPQEEYRSLTIVDPHLGGDNPRDKLGILDVKVHTLSGVSIDIEIQVANVPQMRERVIFYTSKMITQQLKRGKDYQLKKVINIIITDYKLIKEDMLYHHTYQLWDQKNHSIFTDLIEINLLELAKVPQETDHTKLWNWLQFLRAEKEEEFAVLAKKTPEIGKAVGILKILSQDEKTRLLYEAREKQRRDERSIRNYSFKQGIEKDKRDIAKNALKMGMHVEQIGQLTGLDLETIEELAENL